jgi:uncharacterized membrane protein YqiK
MIEFLSLPIISTIVSFVLSLPIISTIVSFVFFGMLISTIKRTKKDTAFVRTGIGGTKVFRDGVFFVLPKLHEVLPINMQAFPVHVSKAGTGNNSLKTKDVFVDVEVIFQIVIADGNNNILNAATRFGNKTFNLHQDQLVVSQLAGTLRDVAATMGIEELQSKRAEFSELIKKTANNHFNALGLKVQSVSIESLRQTSASLLDSEDMFGAQAKAFTAKEVQQRKKQENDAFKDNEIAIQTKNIEIQKQKYNLDVQQANAHIEAEKQKVEFEKSRAIAIAEAQALQDQRSQEAIINSQIEINKRESASFDQKKLTFLALQEANEAETSAETVKQKAIANREKEIGIIQAEQEVESQKVKTIKIAEAKKQAQIIESEAKIIESENLAKAFSIKNTKEAEARKLAVIMEQEAEKQTKVLSAEAELESAQKTSEAIKLLADANQRNYEVESEGKQKMLNAENSLSEEARAYNLKMETIKQMPFIMEAMYKSMEKVGNFSIIHAPGLIGGNSGSSSGTTGTDSLPNQIVDAMNKNKMVTPMIEGLLTSMGINSNKPIDSDILK